MFKINDFIIYQSMSVCKIIDIIQEENPYIGLKSYYVIKPVYSDKSTIIKVPTDNNKISMRHLISKKEIFSIIESLPTLEILNIDNDRQKSQCFKSIIKSNTCSRLAQLVKSINKSEEEKISLGKKISKTDLDFKKIAQKLIHEEFATVLNIPVEDVSSFISNYSEKI